MLTLKVILAIATLFTTGEVIAQLDTVATVFAEVGETNTFLLLSSIITAVFGGLVLIITTRSNARINEMKVAAELEKVKREGEVRVREVQLEAQKALSLVNATQLSGIRNEISANTLKTFENAAQVEKIASKLPRHGEMDAPTEVTVVNPPSDPVNITPVNGKPV